MNRRARVLAAGTAVAGPLATERVALDASARGSVGGAERCRRKPASSHLDAWIQAFPYITTASTDVATFLTLIAKLKLPHDG